MSEEKSPYSKTTRIIHGAARTARWDFTHHVVPPLTSSTTYRLESVRRGAAGFERYGRFPDGDEPPVYIYDRLEDPTRNLLESQLADLEGADACVTFASGMAAVAAALGGVLSAGDALVAHPLLYGCTHSLLTRWMPRLGVSVARADFTDLEAVAAAIGPNTRVLYFESPVNPNLDIVDLSGVATLAAAVNSLRPPERRLLTVIDNTFATPFCQRPTAFGIDLVVHSLTKNIGGFGTEVGGAVLCARESYESLMGYRKDFGGILSPQSAWSILVYGVPTLSLRLKRQQYTAQKVAEFLEGHRLVRRVRYPGLASFPRRALAEKQMLDFDGEFAPGGMIYFELDDLRVEPSDFVDTLAADAYCVTLAVSLGHVKTLVELPSRMTHSAYAGEGAMKAAGGVRLSVGLESPADIITDLENALRAVERQPVSGKTRRTS